MKLIWVFLGMIALSGCIKNCSDTCTAPRELCDKTCYCDVWYEGPDCSVFKSRKFIGTYVGSLITNDTQIVSETFRIYIMPSNPPSLVDSGYLNVIATPVPFANLLLIADTASLNVFVGSDNILFSTHANGSGYLTTDLKRLTLNFQYQSTDSPDYSFIGLRQ